VVTAKTSVHLSTSLGSTTQSATLTVTP
jgi:hypothetical protein